MTDQPIVEEARDDDGLLCEDCFEQIATEFFNSGVGLCGPCAIKRDVAGLTREGRERVLAMALKMSSSSAAAVRRDTLREVREAVEGARKAPLPNVDRVYWQGVNDAAGDILRALDRLEAGS